MTSGKIVALAGGVGGAKLSHGLAQILPPDDLTVIVNVGDDFDHYGLHICPDIDTVMYTLSGYANSETGWGVRDESQHMLEMLENYGEVPWFGLGDRDLATHLLRRKLLSDGHTLTQVTRRLSTALGVQHTILPASDDRCATVVETEENGTLPFQEYFVRHGWQPTVRHIWYYGVDSARPTSAVIEAFQHATAIVICPSNPILSIDPILAVGDLRERLAQRRVPCIAVSPLVHGEALKGPASKIMAELGHDASTDGLMHYYENLIDLLVVDNGDAPLQAHDYMGYYETDIIMQSNADRKRLAQEVLNLVIVRIGEEK